MRTWTLSSLLYGWSWTQQFLHTDQIRDLGQDSRTSEHLGISNQRNIPHRKWDALWTPTTGMVSCRACKELASLASQTSMLRSDVVETIAYEQIEELSVSLISFTVLWLQLPVMTVDSFILAVEVEIGKVRRGHFLHRSWWRSLGMIWEEETSVDFRFEFEESLVSTYIDSTSTTWVFSGLNWRQSSSDLDEKIVEW